MRSISTCKRCVFSPNANEAALEVGDALLRHVTDELRREGTKKVYLITAPESRAAAFYSAHGWCTTRSRIVMVAVIKSS